MKKFFIGLLMMAVFAIGLPLATNAQTCNRGKRKKSYVSRNYTPRYATRGYTYQKPRNNYRNLRNVAIGTGGGAIIGGLIGGNRKSIGIGALVGAGSGALYTYVLRPKKKRNY